MNSCKGKSFEKFVNERVISHAIHGYEYCEHSFNFYVDKIIDDENAIQRCLCVALAFHQLINNKE